MEDKKKDESGEGSEQEFANVFNEVVTSDGSKAKETDDNQPGPAASAPTAEEDKAKTETDTGEGKEAGAIAPTDTDSQGKEKAEADAHVKTLEEKRKRGEKLSDEETRTLYDWLEKEPFEKKLQRHKSLEGMFNSENKKRRELEAENAKFKAEKSTPAAVVTDKDTDKGKATDKGKKPDSDVLSGFMEVPEIKAFSAEYDEIARGVLSIAEHLNNKFEAKFNLLVDSVGKIVSPVIQTHEKTDREKHFAVIKEKHPDFDAYNASEEGQLSELETWIDTLPEYKKLACKKVYKAGITEEVVDMVQDFRNAKGYTGGNGKPPAPPVDKTKIDGHEAVTNRKGPLAASGKGGAQDFEGAFSEATR